MKASKNLIRAIAALVASSVLCVGVCLAWFSANKKVDAGGFNSYAKGVNIAKFQITRTSSKPLRQRYRVQKG